MPISLRKFHSPRAQQLADQIMELAQHYGSDLEKIGVNEIQEMNGITKKTRKNNGKKKK